jgi:pimeloyl-ACP methyl ester carboxylesterase
MSKPSEPTRREVTAGLMILGASMLGTRGTVAEPATPHAAYTRSRRLKNDPTDKAAPADSAKAWLTLPSTPSLPAAKRSDVVTANGVPIFFAQYGEGPTVLLLHGGLANSSYWGLQIPALAEKFSVIVMDTRGHGRSPMTSNKFGYNLFADDAAELLAKLGIVSTSIIGWSDGAITGLQLAITRPALVSRLFAFGANTTVAGLKPGGARTRVFGLFASRCKAEYARIAPHPERWPQLSSGLGAMWRSEPNFTSQQLATIKSATVISDGEYDEIIRREHTEEISREIPNARLMIQPDVSHFAMLQNPAQFNRALDETLSAAN